MILLWQMRQDVEYYTTRALVQAAVDIDDEGKAVQEAWKSYTDAFFPHLKGKRDTSDQAALAMLMKEVKKGGLKVRPVQPLVKSKLHSKRIKHYGPDDNIVSGVRERQSIATPGQQREE